MRHRPQHRRPRYAAPATLVLALAVGTGVVVGDLASSPDGPVLDGAAAGEPSGARMVAAQAVGASGRGHEVETALADPPDGGDGPAELADAGRAVEGLLGWASSPLAGVAALPPTTLEREDPERLYALVTRDQPVEPLRYAPEDLLLLPGGFYEAREEVVAQVTALIDAAADEGHLLVVTSGFRDHDTQAGTYEDWVRRSGSAAADQLSARPGHSEHQLGLAVDLAGTCSYQCFGDTEEGRWVADNAHRWGFITRYPEGGEETTGYAPEPWHLRYVGPRAAWAMHLRGEPYWENFAPLLRP